MEEIWKTVNEWDLYEISNLGRVRSKDRLTRNNKGVFVKKGKLLKPIQNNMGYERVWFRQGGKSKHFFVHRLVAMQFVPNPQNKPCVNHIDNNPLNNKFDNLEWCTKQENTDWMAKQGRNKRTEQWLQRLHESQKATYKPVTAKNIETGEILHFDKINAVKELGFSAGNVCVSCKNGGIYRGYKWQYEEQKDKSL